MIPRSRGVPWARPAEPLRCQGYRRVAGLHQDEQHPQSPSAWAVASGAVAVSLCSHIRKLHLQIPALPLTQELASGLLSSSGHSILHRCPHPASSTSPRSHPHPHYSQPNKCHLKVTPSNKKHHLHVLVKRFIKNMQNLPKRRLLPWH